MQLLGYLRGSGMVVFLIAAIYIAPCTSEVVISAGVTWQLWGLFQFTSAWVNFHELFITTLGAREGSYTVTAKNPNPLF